MDLRRILLYAAERNPDLTAVADDTASLTYRRWANRVLATADGLTARGVRHGDRVAIGMRNSVDAATAFFATQALGAVAVPFNFRFKPEGIAQVLADAGAVAVICDEGVLRDGVPREVTRDLTLVTGSPDAPAGWTSLHELYAGGSSTVHGTVRPDDLSTVLYTSGTTGRPKGVPVTHRQAYARILSYVTSAGPTFDSGLRAFGAAPMYHTVGLHWVLCLTTYLNGSYHAVSDPNPDAMRELIQREELTFLFGSPTLFHMMLAGRGPQHERFSSVTEVSFGSAPMPTVLFDEMCRCFPNATINEVYGTTELSIPFVTRDAPRHPGGALRPTADHRVRVVMPGGSPEDVVAPGEVGELIVDIDNEACTDGYWNAPEKTAEKIRDGWFYTGDAFTVDEHRNYYISGRLDDVIITGGENVQPVEVEQTLLEHPRVKDAAVVGTHEPRWGEVVTAFIVRSDPELTTRELDEHCRLSSLADFKRPRRLVFVDEIPRNPSGKIVRQVVRDLFVTLRGQQGT